MTKSARRAAHPDIAEKVDEFARLFEGSFVNYVVLPGGYLWLKDGALDWEAVRPTPPAEKRDARNPNRRRAVD